jgi:alpha-galactosidase
MSIKVAIIGAGGVGFTRTLLADILSVPEFADTRFGFHDIDRRNLDMVTQLCRKGIEATGLPAVIESTLDRKRALADADYVINCTRIGGLDAFATDIEIPLKYGVDQCVGDTLCIGGIMYGQRNIPAIQDFCRDIKEVSKPGALFLNYANPMAMNTWAALNTGVNCVGLCHGVQNGHVQIDSVLAKFHGDEKIEHLQHRRIFERTQVVCAGINHQTWYLDIRYKGRKVGQEELLAAFESLPGPRQGEKVRIDVLRRFGYYSTESNGHLSEYLPWYRKRADEISKWIDTSCWINGETGGYLRVCREGRNWFKTDFPKWLAEAAQPIKPENRGMEHGSYIIEAMETGRVYRGHFNRRNNGCISNLPADAIIEAPGYVDTFGIHLSPVGELPLACAASCHASINVQRMSVKAAETSDVTLLKQAALHDPLTGAVCDPEEVWQMVDEMLVAQARWLPQYCKAEAIAPAKQRLASVRRKGTYRGTHTGKGAARLAEKSVAQLRKENAASVMSADKAAASRGKAR